MKVEVDRRAMLEAVTKVAKVVPMNSPIKELGTMLVECDDDTGEITLTATNFEVAVRQKFTASVAESGAVLIPPRMLADMLSHLPGEFTSFCVKGRDILTVTGGECTYDISCLPAKNYPKPAFAQPNETARISRVVSLSQRTVFAVSNNEHQPALQCVSIKLKRDGVQAAACDGVKMVLIKDTGSSPNQLEFLLLGRHLEKLAAISSDSDIFEVGNTGKEIVFTRKDLVFSAKKPAVDSFIDTSAVIKNVTPAYTGTANVKELKEALSIITTAASIGESMAPVNLIMAKNKIMLRADTDYALAGSEVYANISQDTPDAGFFYALRSLIKLFSAIDATGKAKIELDKRGLMLIRAKNVVYFQSPMINKAKSQKDAKTKKEPKAAKEAA